MLNHHCNSLKLSVVLFRAEAERRRVLAEERARREAEEEAARQAAIQARLEERRRLEREQQKFALRVEGLIALEVPPKVTPPPFLFQAVHQRRLCLTEEGHAARGGGDRAGGAAQCLTQSLSPL